MINPYNAYNTHLCNAEKNILRLCIYNSSTFLLNTLHGTKWRERARRRSRENVTGRGRDEERGRKRSRGEIRANRDLSERNPEIHHRDFSPGRETGRGGRRSSVIRISHHVVTGQHVSGDALSRLMHETYTNEMKYSES